MSRFIGDGVRIKGRFGDIIVTGRIISSRIISNELMYDVLLDNPLFFRWRDKPVNQILLKNNDIDIAFS